MTLRKSTAAALHRPGQEDVTDYGRWHDPATPVAWASVTKLFLAATVRSLVTDGSWTWETPAAELLGVSAPDELTVRALLEHRSGLPRLLPEQSRELIDPYRAWTDERFDEAVLPRLPELITGEPGREEYSNLGYAVLTRALERDQGQGWLDLLRTRVLTPLGVDPLGFSLGGSGRDGLDVVLSRSLVGGAQWDWDASAGPFSGAGGLCAPVPLMLRTLVSALEHPSELDPRRTPHAWLAGPDGVYTFRGALMRSGSVVVVQPDTGRVGVAHAVGGMASRGAEHAEAALTRLAGRHEEAVA